LKRPQQGPGRVDGDSKPMIVGVLQLEISVYEAMTLKDKRRVMKSLKDRIHNNFNVSIAEVDHNDHIRSGSLGVAIVANERRFVESTLSKVVEFVKRAPQLTLVDYTMETY
jgi:hypothetical protein